MKITGAVKAVFATQQISSSFQKREIVINTSEQYPQSILVELHQGNTALADNLNFGEQVTVHINLRGREWVNPQGEAKYFNTIVGWKIEKDSNNNHMQNGQYHGQGSAVDAYHANNQNNFNQTSHNNQNGFPPTTEEDPDLPF